MEATAAQQATKAKIPGKEKELEFLRRFLQQTEHNICLMYGPPGIGKTFLLKLFQ